MSYESRDNLTAPFVLLTLAPSKRNQRRFYLAYSIEFLFIYSVALVVSGMVGRCCKPQPTFLIVVIINSTDDVRT